MIELPNGDLIAASRIARIQTPQPLSGDPGGIYIEQVNGDRLFYSCPDPEAEKTRIAAAVRAAGDQGLRDTFAAACDPTPYSLVATFHDKHGRNPTIKELADYTTQVRWIEADAMLAARNPV